MSSDLATERAALALFDDLVDVRETERELWIAERTTDAAVKDRLRAMLAADAISSLGTGAAALFTSQPAPTHVGHYRIEGLIGRGGMGAVYRGRRDAGDFDHQVAIKIIKPGLLSDVLTQRFLAERQTLASLSHPNIARLHDGGSTAEGAPYIIMELIDGQPIDRWASSKGLDARSRVALLITAARATAHAHSRLIIHRDITPANVLVTTDATVKLIDFGIARAAEGEMTTSTDIYGLGRVATRLLPAPDAELAAIIARATHADPEARYPTADALADDLQAWSNGMPVEAMPRRRRYVAAKFVARHRLAVAGSAAAVVLLFGALGAVLVANRQARLAEAEAQARFAQTRGIAHALLFPVFDAVSAVPGATRARALLAETGVEYLDALAAMRAAPPDVAAEAGRGYVRLAAVIGGGQAAQLGHYADSGALLARADALLTRAFKAAPGDRTAAIDFARLRVEQAGQALYNDNDTRAGRAAARDARDATARLAATDVEAAALHASALQALADADGWDNDDEKAIIGHKAAEAFIAALPTALREDPLVLAPRSANLRLLGEAQHRRKTAEAAATLARAVSINRALLAARPGDPSRQRKLIASLWYSGVIARGTGQPKAAKAFLEEGIALARLMVARDPADAGGRQMVSITAEILAQLAADRGDAAENARIATELIDAHEALVALAENAAGARRSMASALRTQGGNRYNVGDVPGACAIWRQTMTLYTSLERDGALTDFDRKNGFPETRSLLADICEGGVPVSARPARL
ncbi:serine/threonine-protein kinase [Polymorphobacter multimanifer]|uniref:Serine/threonine-protein kinase n=1 Tax=Polymorphobacter multimanifer TaxID=1070431 RepID=A0A841L547_9SPHN|nr:serine/threonine-protein kinase [Polymorphobacter multimanifer]MBB6227540.1 serine/threonine-protein kinase [Polymorphobacter multimanifer]